MSEAIKSGMCGRCLARILLLWLKKRFSIDCLDGSYQMSSLTC